MSKASVSILVFSFPFMTSKRSVACKKTSPWYEVDKKAENKLYRRRRGVFIDSYAV